MNPPNGLLHLCMESFENNLHLRFLMNNIEFWSHRGSYRKIKAYDSMGRLEKMITRLESLVCQWKQS